MPLESISSVDEYKSSLLKPGDKFKEIKNTKAGDTLWLSYKKFDNKIMGILKRIKCYELRRKQSENHSEVSTEKFT